MEARRRKASALWLRFSQSLASLRHRLSQAIVRSTNQRFGRTTKPCSSERLTISTSNLVHRLGHGIGEARALVTGIGVEPGQERVQSEQGRDQQSAAVAVLDVGRVHDGVQHQALGVDQHMALLSLDLLAGIEAVRIDLRPPFSALLTLWLSMMAAVGLASRPACSRQVT